MPGKIKYNKIVNLPQLIHRVFILLWVVLGFCLILKFLFHQWYPIVVKSKMIIEFGNYVDEHKWLYYAINYVYYSISGNIIILTALKQKMYKRVITGIIFNLLIIASFIIKAIFGNSIGMIVEITYLLIVPIFINIKNKTFNKVWKNIVFVVVYYLIINIWQLNIILIRDVQQVLTTAPFVIVMAMQIDYYIFLLITYMEVSIMGLSSFFWFFGMTETELLAIKEEELQKAYPNPKKLEAIEKALENARNEQIKN